MGGGVVDDVVNGRVIHVTCETAKVPKVQAVSHMCRPAGCQLLCYEASGAECAAVNTRGWPHARHAVATSQRAPVLGAYMQRLGERWYLLGVVRDVAVEARQCLQCAS